MSTRQHRPGPLKQQNKTHKHGKHRSKSELEKATKGKVGAKTVSKLSKKFAAKQERRNQASLDRKIKREEILNNKRGVGATGCPPHLIAIVSLAEDVNIHEVLDVFENCDLEAVVTTNKLGSKHLAIPRFKTRYNFITPNPGDLHSILDAAKSADSILFAYSLENGVDAYGDYVLSVLFGHGIPSSLHAVSGLKNLPTKKQSEAKKILQKHVEKRFPVSKISSLDTPQEALILLRQAREQRRVSPAIRKPRSYLVAEDVRFEDKEDDESNGTLLVTGYVRSNQFSVNGLVHLPGLGDFQVSQIDAPTDPHPLPITSRNVVKGPDITVFYAKADPNLQESLQSEAVVDPLEGEQTWPTDEEIAEAKNRQRQTAEATTGTVKVTKKVPKGTSDYQAAWILDEGKEVGDEDEEIKEDEDEDEEEMSEDDDAIFAPKCDASIGSDEEEDTSQEGTQDDNEYEEITIGTDKDRKYDEAMDVVEDKANLEKLRAERKTEETFPDEVDTPMDQLARARFARYRGLKSFRTSEWDPKENLPLDYSRIFQFEHFERTRKRVLTEDDDETRGPKPGLYVTLHISDVPKSFVHSLDAGAPVVIYQLLQHEQKMSLCNYVLRPVSDAPVIKSKERLVFHVGYRRFSANPIFSQHTNGTRHKYCRFLGSEGVTCASLYAPIIYSPATVLAFKEMKDGSHELVATGTVLSVNPDRIVAKRIVLSGHPYRINTRSAIIRYMFFDRDDINWFKPVELRTKWGRRGHIQDPIGTHGHMRCFFDGKLKSQDTVMMNLFKRVFPKWTYQSRVREPAPLINYKPKTSQEIIREVEMDILD